MKVESHGIVDEGIWELGAEADSPLKPKAGLSGPPVHLEKPGTVRAVPRLMAVEGEILRSA